MINKSVLVTYVSRDALTGVDTSDWIKLERHKEDGYGAQTFGEWMEESQGFSRASDGTWEGVSQTNVFSYYLQYISSCSDGLFVEIEVHKSRPDLDYSISASFGELSPSAEVVEGSKNESHTIRGTDYLELDIIPTTVPNAIWEGKVYNVKGEVISNPEVEYNERTNRLTWNEPVIGVLRVEFDSSYDLYTLVLIPRTNSDVEGSLGADGLGPSVPITYVPQTSTIDQVSDNIFAVQDALSEAFAEKNAETSYQSTIIATWGEGNFETLEIEVSPDDQTCMELAYDNKTVDDDDDDEPVEQCYELHRLYDPCTKELLDEWEETVPCGD